MQADILIKNGLILTMDENLTLFEKADLVIKGSKIVDLSPKTKFTTKKVIDAQGKLVMPGLINCHTHAAMTMMRGLADDMPLDKWWRQYIFPIENKLVNPEFVRIGVNLAVIEMIKSGTTTFSDMYFFEDTVAKVCKQAGIRCFLGEGIIDAQTPDAQDASAALKLTEALHEKWGKDPLVTVMVAPHAPYSCKPETLRKAKALAEKLDLSLHIHVAENQPAEVSQLDEMGFLDERVIAVHAVHLSPAEIQLLKKRKVRVAHCQESNMKLAVGSAPVVEMLQAGIAVGLGTDGAASNNNLDIFDEMDIVAKYNKAFYSDPTVMDAKTVLKMATRGGANVLQIGNEIGSIEIGKKADLILMDLNQPHLLPLYNIYSQLVYSAGGSEVDTVIINGKLIMENRRLLTIDEEEIKEQVKHLAKKIKEAV